jgi:hypothetical protein
MNYNYSFDSLEEFITFIDKMSPADANNSERIGGIAFYGTETLDEAFELVKAGHPETASKVREKFNRITGASRILATNEVYNFQDEGIFFDTATFIEGNPEYWLQPEQTEMKSQKGIVTIYANIATPWDMKQDEYFTRGANVLVLTEALEKFGYSVEIIAVSTSRGYRQSKYDRIHTEIKIKHADQSADLDKIAFILSHRSFFRRLYFHFLEQLPQDIRVKFGILNISRYGFPVESDIRNGIYLGWQTGRYGLRELLNILAPYGNFELNN